MIVLKIIWLLSLWISTLPLSAFTNEVRRLQDHMMGISLTTSNVYLHVNIERQSMPTVSLGWHLSQNALVVPASFWSAVVVSIRLCHFSVISASWCCSWPNWDKNQVNLLKEVVRQIMLFSKAMCLNKQSVRALFIYLWPVIHIWLRIILPAYPCLLSPKQPSCNFYHTSHMCELLQYIPVTLTDFLQLNISCGFMHFEQGFFMG